VGRRFLIRSLIATVCLAGLAWTVLSLGPDKVVKTALEANPWWLGLSVIPIAGRFLIWGFKWRRMLARQSPVPYLVAVRTVAAGAFVNLTTPTAKLAGGIVRAVLLHRRIGWRLSTAYGWSLADQVTNVLGNVLLFATLVLGLAFTPAGATLRPALIAVGLVTLAGLGLVAASRNRAWLWIRRPQVNARLVGWLPKRIRRKDIDPDAARGRLLRILEPLLHRGGIADAFGPDLLLAAVSFASICLASAMVLRSLGVETPLLSLSVAMVLGYFAGVVVGIWGGIGVTEAALTGLYVQLGLPLEQAAAGALLHRAVLYLFIMVVGGLSLLYEGRESTADASATRVADGKGLDASLGDEQQYAGVGEQPVLSTQRTDFGVGEEPEKRNAG
jgi:uncharacterized protein (TIRG00374 family)